MGGRNADWIACADAPRDPGWHRSAALGDELCPLPTPSQLSCEHVLLQGPGLGREVPCSQLRV
eukprot:CAMPEP_0177636282 /NCGR_PEP_ID=MMETSP0447-20121125/4355_1 /TAXON_ID=0 /ORGANISM="Stygamoeba regulata, Strain BSH-02190019" /LENGTH=62 /DNA_ID=CAMNT_0019138133 /DNA_START=90 /DNA_END=278 /DNA_ORIENTATION=+